MHKEDRIAAEHRARKDLLSLLKAYARLGYRQTNTDLDDGFDQLWNAAFPDDESETASPADE
jgi:hypothetical protein